MKTPRTIQEWIHWMEMGAGARWLGRGALLLGIGLFSLLVAYKQFRGPQEESVFLQADLGRQLVSGHGFTTRVNYPQTAALLETRPGGWNSEEPFPELSQPPLYAMCIAVVLALLPAQSWLIPPVAPGGVAADYGLLAANLLLLWCAAGQTWLLARRLFDAQTATLAMLALLLSATVWSETVAVNGTPLMMVLLLGIFQCRAAAETARSAGRAVWPWLGGAGLGTGLLFLCDYTTAFLLPVLAIEAAWSERGPRRWLAGAVILGAALLTAGPWAVRNLEWTGSPVALARHDAALRAGDPLAEPAVVRRMLTDASPDFEFRKFANKGLTAMQRDVGVNLWSGGGFLAALFLVGWLYRFRNADAVRLRRLFTISFCVLLLAQGFFSSGESIRMPAVYAAPLVILFGAGFFSVLAASHATLADWPRLAGAGLLALQALPLLQDVLEPRQIHFSYPPYHPTLYQGMHAEMSRMPRGTGWMADTPAGAAWYSGSRVWAQPATLREFHEISVNHPVAMLVLSPHTLDRPFFRELNSTAVMDSRFGDWGRVYTGMITGRLPGSFPLTQPQKLADNFYILMDPAQRPIRGK